MFFRCSSLIFITVSIEELWPFIDIELNLRAQSETAKRLSKWSWLTSKIFQSALIESLTDPRQGECCGRIDVGVGGID